MRGTYQFLVPGVVVLIVRYKGYVPVLGTTGIHDTWPRPDPAVPGE